MAQCTDSRLRRSVIYELYVRSHTPQGTFRAVVPDLDRIAALGVDIIWLMPIHPIGVKNKKGSLGCPFPAGLMPWIIRRSVLTATTISCAAWKTTIPPGRRHASRRKSSCWPGRRYATL